MAATNLTACLSSIKYSHGVAWNCKTGSNTAPNWSPSQLLDTSYYRNQSLGTGAHSRKSCRFQFYIVINAAGEENFTTIAGADCTNAELFYPTTPQMNVPTHTIPLLLVLKWFFHKAWVGMAPGKVVAFFNGFIRRETRSFLHVRSPCENN